MDELKPCPFCGGQAEIVQIGNLHTKKRGFEVRCLTWGCSTKKSAMVIRQSLEQAKEWAIAAWNTRTPDPEALIAIARAMQERLGAKIATLFFCQGSSGNMADHLTLERAGEAILSLDPEALVREYMEKK